MPEEIPPTGPQEVDKGAESPTDQPLPARLVHQSQEPPLDAPESRCSFQTGPERQLIVTPAAVQRFGMETVIACFFRLQYLARLHNGVDYLQIFEDPNSHEELWFIEDAPGVITALMPDDR